MANLSIFAPLRFTHKRGRSDEELSSSASNVSPRELSDAEAFDRDCVRARLRESGERWLGYILGNIYSRKKIATRKRNQLKAYAKS